VQPIGESVMDISLAKPLARNKQREKWRYANGGSFYGYVTETLAHCTTCAAEKCFALVRRLN